MAHTSDVARPLANYPQDIWGHHLLSLPFNQQEFDFYTNQVEGLKETVKDMVMDPTTDPLEKVHLINSLCRLGVSYHFESEIEEQLNHLFIILPELLNDKDYSLHTVALVFQVFRFNGYKMSCGVFSKFQDDDGKFKEEVVSDMKGMVGLYEASHFRTKGEIILDEALGFTTEHLRLLANQTSTSPHLREYIENALFRAYHYSFQRYEAKLYISFYEGEESRDDVLLKFAKFDFNRVQLLHQQELKVLLRWYKELELEAKLPHARHRMVESFFYCVGIYFEPRYAVGRNILAKQTCLIGFVDDVYEAYGFYEELKYFTDAVRRFEISAIDELPTDNQKTTYETLLSSTNEAEDVIQKEGRSYAISYVEKEWKNYAEAEEAELRWKHEAILPTFDDYLENGLYSGASLLNMTQIMLGISEADQNTYEWMTNNTNNLPRAVQICTRLYNDIVTDEVEEKRGLVTASACYMKQHNVSRDEAVRAFRAMIADAWKDVNENSMRLTAVPMRVMKVAVCYLRLLDFAYRDHDAYTSPRISFKRFITKVLIEPIPLD
ncbi:hypothetical protein V6N12_061549 [Hibiscus sabdariffa]|uniref:(+)-delta-cadinene synthase n=1 Tax=Hibiscus sabdariffa TaxID=183260 RepID=A0ABR2DXD5_9ROSI